MSWRKFCVVRDMGRCAAVFKPFFLPITPEGHQWLDQLDALLEGNDNSALFNHAFKTDSESAQSWLLSVTSVRREQEVGGAEAVAKVLDKLDALLLPPLPFPLDGDDDAARWFFELESTDYESNPEALRRLVAEAPTPEAADWLRHLAAEQAYLMHLLGIYP